MQLQDQEARLALFAEGIAGRYFHIKSSTEFTSRRINLAPDQASSTIDTLFLPDQLDVPGDAGYRVLVLQQLAYHEFGTFAFSVHQARREIAQLGALPMPAPRRRCSDFELYYQHVEYPALLRRLFNTAELYRVTARMCRRYPGIRRHHDAFRSHGLSTADMVVTSIAELPDALDVCASLIGLDVPLPADATGLLANALAALTALGADDPAPLTADELPLAAGVYRAASAALAIYHAWLPVLQAVTDVPDLAFDEDLDDADTSVDWLQREARLEDWREELKSLEDQMLAVETLLNDDEARVADAESLMNGEIRPDDLALKSLGNERDNLSRRIDMERAAIREALGESEPHARSYRYDEWNYLSRSYIGKWCRLYEMPLEADVDADLGALMRTTTTHRTAVQRQFEQIKPLGLQRLRHMLDGDELDLTALVEARQDVLAGHTPDDRVYSRRERVQRDLCTAFLVDLSASTDDAVEPPDASEPGDLPDPQHPDKDPFDQGAYVDVDVDLPLVPDEPQRRIIDLQRESMLIMAAALERLGDSYGIYGFSGYGHDCVEYFVAKEPQHPFNLSTLQAIAAMKPKRSTRMGPAIRHSTAKLLKSGNALKLLIIVSDGFPQDSDYGPERGDHEYGLQDTAKALQEAHSKGVETFCITVDRSGHDYLRRMCPASRYMVIEEVEELPDALSKVYEALTA